MLNTKIQKNKKFQQRLDGSEYLITGDKAFYLEATGSYPGQGLEGSRAWNHSVGKNPTLAVGDALDVT